VTAMSPAVSARELRRRLGIEERESVDIAGVVRRMELQLAVVPVPAGPQGMYGELRGDPWIYVNSHGLTPASLGRMRFTIAHELGHHVLGHGAVLDEHINSGAPAGDEYDANAFAAEFMVPEAGIRYLLGDGDRGSMSLDTLVDIAARYGASCLSVYHRLDFLKLLSAHARRSLRSALDGGEHLTTANRARLDEFADSLSRDIRGASDALLLPKELQTRVAAAWEEGLLDDATAAEYLGIEVSVFVRRMRQQGIERQVPPETASDAWW
jgi:Zn-dependent peptidase ImmA (M78 family)